MKEAILKLCKIKSIVTIVLTLVFAAMLIVGLFREVAIPQEFVMIYTTVIAFYFGTQYSKNSKTDDSFTS